MLRNPSYRAFLILILSSIGFYNPLSVLSPGMQKACFYLCVVFCFYEVMMHGVSLRKIKAPFTAYWLLLISIVVSALMASMFHPQPLTSSLVTILPFLFSYLTLYLFFGLDISHKQVMMTMYVLAGIGSVAYFANALAMPRMLFGQQLEAIDDNRGIIRIPVLFIEFMPMMVFYAINRYLIDKQRKWLIIIGWLAVMIFLSVIRQIMALTLLLGLWFYFKSVSVTKKLTIIVVVGAVVLFVLPQIPVYQTLVEISEDQRDDTEENIRVTAWRYYLYENQTNGVTAIFGNGVPSLGISPWGIQVGAETQDNGCFAEDVGWAGFYWYFGAIATICLMILMIKGLLRRKAKDSEFINYGLIFVMITSIASAPILYYWQIVMVMVAIYMAYTAPQTMAEVSDGNGEVAQAETPRHRYFPQIERKKREKQVKKA